ncbi:YaeQ family protein [Aliivibrio kagoshimensis]|jgi:uncharacterized protein YaeQ|uniref:YaeQ family protein n=1 Tax=Aliivibrio kagoshimensis TaxID=2910230 RepID=UPI003D104A2B
MALKATIYKANVNVADMDRNVYMDETLTIARHPSETAQRMMLRVLAWVLNADEHISFTKGLSADDEPELWIKNYSNEIELWIDLGMPDEKRLKKACGRSKQVLLYVYGDRASSVWWQQNQQKLSQLSNLTVVSIEDDSLAELTAFEDRAMNLQFSLQDGQVWLTADSGSCCITPVTLQGVE